MSHKYCPQCGGSVSNDAKYCYQCGAPLSPKTTSGEASQASSTSLTTSPSRPLQKAKKKKSQKISIGYLIFLIFSVSLLLFLLVHKFNAPAEKTLKSKPSERPVIPNDTPTDEENDSLLSSSIPLSSSVPDIHIPDIPASTPTSDDFYYQEDDTYAYSYPSNDQTNDYYSSAPSGPTNLTTEQSIRNLLVSNRFMNNEGESITFSDNGNKLMMNGETIATSMEIQSGFTSNHAIMIYENDNSSWDVALSTDGGRNRIRYMAEEFVAQ